VANVADAAPAPKSAERTSWLSRLRGIGAATEIDFRLFGMLVALAVILMVFNVLNDGKFFRPINMVTLAVQATSVAILATGMVLIIVSRNIDLSVGSLVGFIAMTYALLMSDWMPNVFHMGDDFPFRWVIALAFGIGVGALFGAVQGFIIAYIGVPSFVVTLGGLMSFRGAAFLVADGKTQPVNDEFFQRLGGSKRSERTMWSRP